MSRLNVIDDALLALAAELDAHGHGAACVCGACQAHREATTLLPQLHHVVFVLQAWERGEAEEPILPEDIGTLLQLIRGKEAQ